MRSRALLNGVDVSSRCFYADDRRGFVRLYKLDAGGRMFTDRRTGDIATEQLHGSVVIERGFR